MENKNEPLKRRALGRGLEELFNNEPIDYNKIEEKIVTETPKDEVKMIKIEELRSNPYQPRKNFDPIALQELSKSIKEHGVFQPIIAKKSIKGYEIIAGERRVKASTLAGLKEIPAIIRDFSDDEMMEIALLENLQRENLNAIEEATAYKNLIKTLNLTQEQLAERLGKSRSHITNMIGILSLPETTQNLISKKEISMGHARILSKLKDENQINELTDKIITEGISVRQLEDLTSNNTNFERKNKIERLPRKEDTEYSYLEDSLSEKLGTRVKIKKNKVQINFTNSNDLNRILEIMNLNK
jgi:hypothetical protein